jgi:hypothetical protein
MFNAVNWPHPGLEMFRQFLVGHLDEVLCQRVNGGGKMCQMAA